MSWTADGVIAFRSITHRCILDMGYNFCMFFLLRNSIKREFKCNKKRLFMLLTGPKTILLHLQIKFLCFYQLAELEICRLCMCIAASGGIFVGWSSSNYIQVQHNEPTILQVENGTYGLHVVIKTTFCCHYPSVPFSFCY